jgi:sugar/nucleoside kinase (ribokinase family)
MVKMLGSKGTFFLLPVGRRKMLDIIGIGSLNLDYTATAEKINALPPDRGRAAMRLLEFGAERPAEQDDINNIMSLLGPGSFRATLGGSAFNTIHAIAALNAGIKTGYVGVAGHTGGSGLNFTKLMRELAIDNKHVGICSDQSSGICICINHDGIRSLLYNPGCNNYMSDYLHMNYHDILQYLIKARILHITPFTDDRTPVILAEVIQEAKSQNPAIRISCDPGYSWSKNLTPAVISILKLADYLFVNTKEFVLLGGGGVDISDTEIAGRIFTQYGLMRTLLILKDEAEIVIFSPSNQQAAAQRFEIDVISNEQISDATGAGDIFAAGFLTVQLLGGKAIPDAVELGMRFMGAKLITPPEQLYPELAHIYPAFWRQTPEC